MCDSKVTFRDEDYCVKDTIFPIYVIECPVIAELSCITGHKTKDDGFSCYVKLIIFNLLENKGSIKVSLQFERLKLRTLFWLPIFCVISHSPKKQPLFNLLTHLQFLPSLSLFHVESTGIVNLGFRVHF